MGIISREEAKQIVIEALEVVADINTDDVDHFLFSQFNDFQLQMFADALNEKIENEGFSITLNNSIISGWNTIGDCIDYVEENIFMDF